MANYLYTYTGNQLANINTSEFYSYDKNGNANSLRGFTIYYNLLNLPCGVLKGLESITYIYSAAGEKLAKKMKDNTYQYYAGNMIYKNDKTLNYLLFDEGMVTKTSAGYTYEYHLKDHLGNTRVAFQPNGSATTTTQVAEYYPFGASYLPLYNAGTDNKYLYNGKEKQDDVLSGTALDWYDYGARFYDPMIGRWHCIDPKADLLESSSPFVYSLNNPVNFIDRDGELPIYVNGLVSSESERGNKSYWDKELLNTIRSSGIANPGGEEHFVDGDRGAVYNGETGNYELGLTHAYSINPGDRQRGGGMAAKEDFAEILSKLERNPENGKIIEKIQIYSHSRGGAFSIGYTEALMSLITKYADQFEDPTNVIEFMLHLAPHQSNSLSAVNGVDNFGISHKKDLLSGSGIDGATNFTTNEGSFRTAHGNASFTKDVKAFIDAYNSSGGNSQKATNDFVNRMKNRYGITVNVE